MSTKVDRYDPNIAIAAFRYNLREIAAYVREAQKAVDKRDWSDLLEVLNEIDGFSAMVREAAESRLELEP